jgi:DNA-binding transcriptional MerR regulator
MSKLNFYTIQQASQISGVSSHTLRYYERIDLLPPISRAENGHRQYTDSDLHWVYFLTLLRVTDMPIAVMKTYVDLERQGPKTEDARLAIMQQHRQVMQDKISMLQDSLQAIDRKILVYEGKADSCVAPKKSS